MVLIKLFIFIGLISLVALFLIGVGRSLMYLILKGIK